MMFEVQTLLIMQIFEKQLCAKKLLHPTAALAGRKVKYFYVIRSERSKYF